MENKHDKRLTTVVKGIAQLCVIALNKVITPRTHATMQQFDSRWRGYITFSIKGGAPDRDSRRATTYTS